MEITLEKKDNVTASLKINLKEEDYKQKYADKLKEYGKKVQLKGFRPGKVPQTIVEKMYGKSILADEINHLLSDTIQNYIKDNQIDILGDPLPKADEQNLINWDTQKDFSFSYNLGLSPEFNLDLSSAVAVDKYNITFNDKVLKETIDNLRKQFGVYKDTEISEAEDIIYAQAKDSNGKEYKCILPEFRVEASEKDKFIGIKVGDVINADIRKVLAADAAVAYVLGVDKKEAVDIHGQFSFTIERISHPEIADLNEEFYTKVFRGVEVKTNEEFESKLKENIETSYKSESKNALFNDLFEYYTKNTKIDFPVEFLKDWLFVVNEGKLTKEQIEEQYPNFELGLRWDLIKNKIAKQFEIKVEHPDVMVKAKNMVKAQFGMLDSNLLDDQMEKMIEGWADNLLKKDNGKQYRQLFEEVYSERVLEAITSKIKLNEKSLTIEEFQKLREAKK